MHARVQAACSVLVAALVVVAAAPAAAASRNYVYVGSAAGAIYGVDVDSGAVRFLSTSTETAATINALAANGNACLAYYGDATSIYHWDETTDVHTLIADLSTASYAPPFAGFSLQSGGGSFWNPTNTYYVGAERPGDVEALYALVMTPDGTGIVSISRLDIQGDAASDSDPGDAVADLGGFGDVIAIDNGSGGVLLLGATWNSGAPGVLTTWTYDPAAAAASARFTKLTPPPGGLNLQLARTPDGRVWAGFDAPSGPNAGQPVLRELAIDLDAKTVDFTGDEIPLDPVPEVTDLTGPACRPQIGVAKRVAAGPTPVGDDSFSVTFELLIEALGDFTLRDVQVTDELAAEFGALVSDTPDAPGEYAVTAGPTITDENPAGPPPNSELTANPDFDGATDTELLLLVPGDRVEVGATVTLELTLRFVPALGRTVFANQARASGDSREDGTPDGDTFDDSDDGLEPDPDGDDNPDEEGSGCTADPTGVGCENDPTVLELPTPEPQIGIAKTVSDPVANGDGSFTVSYTLLVANLGDVELFDLRVTDDLTASFGGNVAPALPAAPAEFSVGAVAVAGASGGATVATANPGFDGDADRALVLPVAGETMPVGSSFTISFELRFVPDFARSPWNNLARATGDVAEDGTADEDTEDLSDDGTDADPNDNGDPGEPGEDDPTPLPPFPGEATPIPASGPLAVTFLALALALLGWVRLRGAG